MSIQSLKQQLMEAQNIIINFLDPSIDDDRIEAVLLMIEEACYDISMLKRSISVRNQKALNLRNARKERLLNKQGEPDD